jgi:hypothetical protein
MKGDTGAEGQGTTGAAGPAGPCQLVPGEMQA